jgi:AcrR family transcriptional regulator
MPTGTPIPGIREQLFGAAERVLLSGGPDALTSRAVTTEAGVAKGILHRHFSDFDAFLAAFVLTRIERLDAVSAELRASAGLATVTDNLARALATALDPVTVLSISLVCWRRDVLARLRLTTPKGLPLATEMTRMIAAYLTAERGLGRIALETDVDSLGLLLVGAAHLRATERDGVALDPDDLRDIVKVAIETPRNTTLERLADPR